MSRAPSSGSRRAPFTLALLMVLAAVVASTAAAPPAVQGATSVQIAARTLVGGRYASGGWLALEVSLANPGAPTSGHVTADSSDGVVRRPVELPAGAQKSVALYVRPQAFARKVEVRWESEEGNAVASVEVRVLDRSARHVAIVGDGAGHLRGQIAGDLVVGRAEPLTLAPADLPARPEPLAGISAMVWAADSVGLGTDQRRAIERWVAGGGQLVVVGGADWQSRTAAFDALLPITGIATRDDVPLAALATWAGSADDPASEPGVAVASGTLAADGRAIVSAEDGTPLVAVNRRGAGRVVYLAADLATPAFRAWPAAGDLWARLLPADANLEQFFGGFPVEEEAANQMASALSNLPSLDVPPVELLLAVVVAYILLIGPISYLVLRRLDRRELAWITAPILVIVFSACSYGIGTAMKGSQVILNQVSLVRVASGGSAASVETWAGLFSPTRSTYDLTAEGDALVAPVTTFGFDGAPAAPRSAAIAELGDPAHLRGVSVGVFGFQALRSDSVAAYTPSLEVTWSLGDGEITGTVVNVGDAPIEDVAVVSIGGGRMVGDLEPGEREEFSLSMRNFQGTPASDQVYGFGGFDPSDPSQRATNVRRQVINALVGYGGWMPGGGLSFGIGPDRGPYVIGWRADDEGPAPITIDGETAERYHQVVEVVSGRPALGPGQVTLGPAQLPARVIATDGDASAADPAWVTVGDGSVTFAITLPLEASGLRPTAVRLIAGTDPGMVFGDQGGGFGAVMPPGYTLEVRDAETGAWRLVGDLSNRSSFDIDDPGSVLGEAGRIEVRVVGSEIDPTFGTMNVFVGAEVSGVIP